MPEKTQTEDEKKHAESMTRYYQDMGRKIDTETMRNGNVLKIAEAVIELRGEVFQLKNKVAELEMKLAQK